MKFLIKLLKVIAVLLILIVVGTWLYSKTYHPNYKGELEINYLSDEVTIYFDEIGLAELSSNNPLKVLHSYLENENL